MFIIAKAEISQDKNCFCLIAINNDPYFILPLIVLPPDRLIIKMEITPPKNTTTQVFYLLNENDTYSEELSVKNRIGPGRTHIQIITQFGAKGKVKLNPSGQGEVFQLPPLF